MEGEQAAAQEGASGESTDAASTDSAVASGSLLPGVPTPTEVPAEPASPEAEADIETTNAAADGADAVEAAQADADAAQAEEQAKEDSGEPADPSLAEATSLSSFMELEARVATHVAGCEGEACNEAYTQAFGLYKYTYGVNKGNAVHFEKERASLGGFRDGLKALIKKKEDKMAALAAQLKELEASLANPGPTLESLFALIKKHLDVNIEACSLMAGRTTKMLALLSDGGEAGFLELLKAGKIDCAGEPPAVDIGHEDTGLGGAGDSAATPPVPPTPPPAPVIKTTITETPLPEAPKPETIVIPDVPQVKAIDIPVASANDEQTEIGSEIFDQQIGEQEHEQAKN